MVSYETKGITIRFDGRPYKAVVEVKKRRDASIDTVDMRFNGSDCLDVKNLVSMSGAARIGHVTDGDQNQFKYISSSDAIITVAYGADRPECAALISFRAKPF